MKNIIMLNYTNVFYVCFYEYFNKIHRSLTTSQYSVSIIAKRIYASQRGASEDVAIFSALLNPVDAQSVSEWDFVGGIFA